MIKKSSIFNWPIIGNRPIIDYLQKVISQKKLVHAYLFNGPAHIGKLTTAEYFIASLLCERYHQKNNNPVNTYPCYACNDCQRFFKKNHPDVFFVDKIADKKDIALEQIQQLRYNLKMSSFYASYKIGVINQAEFLNSSSVNALLKTLEEPTKNTIIILIVNNINVIPSTIKSRCQIFNFEPVSQKEIEEGLLQKGASRELVYELSRLCLGKPGLAMQYWQTAPLLAGYHEEINKVLNLRKQSISDKILYYQNLSPNNDFTAMVAWATEFMDIWRIILRDLILAKINLLNLVTNYFIREDLENLSKKYTLFELKQECDNLSIVQKRLKMNVNPKLLIENFLINTN